MIWIEEATMSRIYIIGFGSTLRGDDAFGPMVAEQLLERVTCDEVRIDICQGMTPDLALPLSEADVAIFIDCSAEGTVGELVHRTIEPRESMDMSMVHFLDPEALLAWSAKLYGRVPVSHVLTTAGATFEIAEALSPRVEPIVAEAMAAAERIIHEGQLSHA
jgi:hydrogenase maturation protease